MDINKKLMAQSKIISDLDAENEQLKKELTEAEVKLALSEKNNIEFKDNAKYLLSASQEALQQYQQIIQEAEKYKQMARDELYEIYKLQAIYLESIKQFKMFNKN